MIGLWLPYQDLLESAMIVFLKRIWCTECLGKGKDALYVCTLESYGHT